MQRRKKIKYNEKRHGEKSKDGEGEGVKERVRQGKKYAEILRERRR